MAPGVPSILSFGLALLFALQSLADLEYRQKPLVELDNTGTDNSKFPEIGQLKPTEHSYPSQNTEITIYRETEHACVSKKGQPVSNIEIPMDTCATGNFTLDGRVFLGFHGLCEGWKTSPSMYVYPGPNCSGGQKRLPWRSAGLRPGHCLTKFIWDDLIRDEMKSHQEWSIMFKCSEDESVTTETPKMDIAEPAPPPPPVEKPEAPRLEVASVSDSACYMPELGSMEGRPRLVFQLPLPDICVNVEPWHKLKIYEAAFCSDGSEAKFAKWYEIGCRGKPISVQEVDESLKADDSPNTCIKMGGQHESSYAFVCGDDTRVGAYAQSVLAGKDEDDNERHIISLNEQNGGRTKSGAMRGSCLDIAWRLGVSLGFLSFQLLL